MEKKKSCFPIYAILSKAAVHIFPNKCRWNYVFLKGNESIKKDNQERGIATHDANAMQSMFVLIEYKTRLDR